MLLVVFAVQRTSAEHEELEDLSLERSVTNRIVSTEPRRISGFVSNNRICFLVHRHKDAYPLHPRVFEHLRSTEAQCCITNQQL